MDQIDDLFEIDDENLIPINKTPELALSLTLDFENYTNMIYTYNIIQD